MVNRPGDRSEKAHPPGDGPFGFVSSPAGRILKCRALEGVADHLFTTRQLEFRGDSIDDDYGLIGATLGVGGGAVLRVRQVHGRDVLVLRSGDSPATGADADAVLSAVPGAAASVRIADCVPILLADRRGRAVAAVHAGWRGAAAGVVPATVAAFEALGVAPDDLMAVIGPAIGPCCYQVDEPVRAAFRASTAAADAWFTADGGRWRLDLPSAATDQLASSGVPREAIHRCGLCTAHRPADFFSHRRDGAGTGRMVAAIRLHGI